jgi:phosphate transport system protein
MPNLSQWWARPVYGSRWSSTPVVGQWSWLSGDWGSVFWPVSSKVVSELRSAFQKQLQTLEASTIQLFAFVAEDLAVATAGLLNNDASGLEVVSERERVIDGLYPELEHLLNAQLILEAPVARDFRLVISMLRIVPELERSHDLVVHIAEHADHMLGDELSPRSRGLVQRMGETGTEMWNEAAKAWHQRDPGAAEALDERDDDMDGLHAALLTELASGKMSIPVVMEMTLVGRYYERLGDHSVNIARRVAYLAGPTNEVSSQVHGR